MKAFSSLICRIFFIGAFLFLICAISEKFAIYLGKSIFRYPPSQLLGFSVVSLLFVIALELRNIKISIEAKRQNEKELLTPMQNKNTSKLVTVFAVFIIIAFLLYS